MGTPVPMHSSCPLYLSTAAMAQPRLTRGTQYLNTSGSMAWEASFSKTLMRPEFKGLGLVVRALWQEAMRVLSIPASHMT